MNILEKNTNIVLTGVLDYSSCENIISFESDKRKSFVGLLLLMVLASFAEVMSLGIVMKKKKQLKCVGLWKE